MWESLFPENALLLPLIINYYINHIGPHHGKYDLSKGDGDVVYRATKSVMRRLG